MYKTLIVPVDISHAERAPAMFGAARTLAAKNAKIVLFHAVAELPSYVIQEMPSGIVEENLKIARATLDKLARDSGLTAKVEIRSGNAANAILDFEKEIGADAIVIASHKPGWQDYLIGSTAARVVRHAQCSVFVVR